MKHNLHADYEVSDFVKPGSGIGILTSTAGDEMKCTKNDVLVFWRGTKLPSSAVLRINTEESITVYWKMDAVDGISGDYTGTQEDLYDAVLKRISEKDSARESNIKPRRNRMSSKWSSWSFITNSPVAR